MTRKINQKDINKEYEKIIIEKIEKGEIFIYPTDTIYGIGCNALNKKAVKKINKIKCRENKPFSIIAPSINWIKKNCIIPKKMDIKKYLPGPYTLILKKKDPSYLKHVSDIDSLGIRIPKNKIIKVIQKTKKPFITTSVNLTGEKPLEDLTKIKKSIRKKIDYIIDAGILTGKPSTLIINGKKIKRN